MKLNDKRYTPRDIHVAAADRISQARLVIDCEPEEGEEQGARLYLPMDPDVLRHLAHDAAHALKPEQKEALVISLLNVLTPDRRTSAIAQAVGSYHTPLVSVEPEESFAVVREGQPRVLHCATREGAEAMAAQLRDARVLPVVGGIVDWGEGSMQHTMIERLRREREELAERQAAERAALEATD